MSVANARCDGSIELTSQKNRQVSIAAPGMAILSTAPRSHGTIRGHLSSEPPVATGGAKAGSTAATSVVLGYLANGFKVWWAAALDGGCLGAAAPSDAAVTHTC
jgi:hypothetical protein